MLARLAATTGDEARARDHQQSCFAILDAFHRENRPMDPQMRQLHAQLSKMLGGADAEPAPQIDPATIPAQVVEQVFSAPEAQDMLRQVMDANGLNGAPADLPMETKKAIVAMLIQNGVIQTGEGPEGGGEG